MGNGFAFHYLFLKYYLMHYFNFKIFTTLLVSIESIAFFAIKYWKFAKKVLDPLASCVTDVSTENNRD